MKSRPKCSTVRNRWCSTSLKIACTCRKQFCTPCSDKNAPCAIFLRNYRVSKKTRKRACENGNTETEKGSPCVLRRSRYLHYYSVAQGKLRLRSHRHDRRRGPAGKPGIRAQKGSRHGRFDCIRGRLARRIHPRLH